MVLGFVAAWTVLPGSPLWWTLALVGVAALPVLRPLMRLRAGPDRREPMRVFVMRCREELGVTISQVLITLLLLPYHAWLMTHAIGVTLLRMFVTKKHLLVWETAAQAHANGSYKVGRFLEAMIVSPLAARVEQTLHESTKLFECIKVTLLASLNGYSPALAVEFGRKVLYSTERPSFIELEQHVKQSKSK